MKVTDPEVIKAGEKDLIDSVKEDLDWDVVKEIVKKKMSVTSFESEGGEIVVHNNQIAFRLDLALKLNVSLMFDRDGSYIPDGDGTPDDALSIEEDAGELDLVSDDDFDLGDMEIEASDPEPILSDVDDDGDADLSEPSGGEQILELEQIVLPDEASEGKELDLEEISLSDDGFDEKELNLEEISLSDEEDADSGIDLEEISLVDEGSDESLDDDIDDILKESREFWEQKKDNE